MQLTDDEFAGLNASFTFTKGTSTQTLTPANVLPSFKSISIQWVPTNTALNDVNADKLFSVYPNPTSATAYVAGFGIKSIELCTLNGKHISTSSEQQLNLERLPKAVYLAKIYTKSGVYIKKIEKN
jgi:hypothetical protein